MRCSIQVLRDSGMAGSISVDPSHYCVDAFSCVLLETGLLKGNTVTTTIQPYALPKMEPNSESVNISMDSDCASRNGPLLLFKIPAPYNVAKLLLLSICFLILSNSTKF